MAGLVAVIPYALSAVGALASAKGNSDAGIASKREAYIQAGQLDDEANDAQAASQREAIDERKQAARAASRALAVSAASGGGASDPTVVQIISDIEGEGEYRALSRLYQGNAEASNLHSTARAARRTGQAQERAGKYRATSSILQGGASLFSMYNQ